jgi:hypothetical protein
VHGDVDKGIVDLRHGEPWIRNKRRLLLLTLY